MSVKDSSVSVSNPAARPRVPLLVAAWTQLGLASLLLLTAGQNLFPPINLHFFLLLLVMVLLYCSAGALLMHRPWSWWAALLVQIPLLAYEVWISLDTLHAIQAYDPRSDLHGVEPYLNRLVLAFAFLLSLCSLTAVLYLLRPRTRVSFGLPATARESTQVSARAYFYLMLGIFCLVLRHHPAHRLVLSYQLWDAVWNRDTVSLTRLLNAGADVDFRDARNGWTPLIAATSNRMEEVALVLVKARANVNAHDVWGGTPLILATSNRMDGTVKALLEAGADVNARDRWGHTPLLAAMENGDSQMAKLLQAHGAVPTSIPGDK